MPMPEAASATSSKLFDLSGRVAVITGGAGFLGSRHAEAIAEFGGIPVLADIQAERASEIASDIRRKYSVDASALRADVTRRSEVTALRDEVLGKYGRVDILINNAACDPKVGKGGLEGGSRFESFPQELWEKELAVGLTGAFLCSQVIGTEMARRGAGVILNIASDLGVIAPDQRIYEQKDLPQELQPAKPVSYCVVKSALIGLTRYLATYWAGQGVRVNALSPGGVYKDQDEAFVRKLTHLIPLGRMASPDEYKGAIVFLCSDASGYMTGFNVVMDGGRSAW